ncbi:nicotinate-nucleotide adenylyltransferase [Rubrivirga sp. IMCC45206]|uniref:nicotinate-nucleotide adenylyltransferase n=1 Tax=Rubrivirga sp. IMCC45206 TaxID=3391614 RepID=UPI00398FD649
MPLGVFGGSFNPPHVGHLAVAEACADAAGLDRVLWIPAATSPHKVGDPSLAPAEARLAMVRAAVEGNDRFAVSDIEIAREGVSYTVDTLRQLAAEGAGPLALIVGGDSLAGFPSWREPRAILDLATLVVYRRPGDAVDLSALPDWLASALTVVEGPSLAVSSTEIRERVASGQTVRYLVPDVVRTIIEAEGLYGAG